MTIINLNFDKKNVKMRAKKPRVCTVDGLKNLQFIFYGACFILYNLNRIFGITHFDTFRAHDDHFNVCERFLNITFATETVFGVELRQTGRATTQN